VVRRFAAAVAVAFAVLVTAWLPPAPAGADHPEIGLEIHIVGGQFLYKYAGDLRHLPGAGPFFENSQPLWGMAGFVGVPSGPPVYAFRYPAGFWPLITITNHDPVRHEVTQCGARFTEPDCILVPEPYLRVDLGPGETRYWQPGDEELELLRGPQHLTDRQPQYRWMRGLVCFDKWRGTGSRDCGNYPYL
jgi:hypothetical protein